MSAVAGYAGGVFAVLKRDAIVYASYRGRLAGQLVTMAFAVTAFYYVSRLVGVEEFPTPDDYFAFVVVGVVVLRALVSTFGVTALALRQELVAGTFERMAASPFGATAGTVAMVVFPFALSLVISAGTIGFAALAFGLPLSWPTLPLAAPAAVLVALAFAPFALLIAALVISFKQGTGAVGLVLAVTSLVSGLIFPVSLLPGWLRWMSEVQPFTPAVDLLRHLIVGAPLQTSAWLEVAKIAGFAAVLLPLSIGLVHFAVRTGRRRATLTEY